VQSLAELSRGSGLHHTTVYRLLTALLAAGLVERTNDRKYRLGPGLITLGFRALRANDLSTLAREELLGLAAVSGEGATLEIPLQGELMILDEAPGPGLVGIRVEVGTRWPLHATATGKALLAAARSGMDGGDEEPGLRLPDRLPALTPQTAKTRRELEAQFDQIRTLGYAATSEELQIGYAAVGAAVLDHRGSPVAALGIGGPSSRLTADRIPTLGALIRSAARRLSQRLGAPAGSAEAGSER
jgi:IclR family transcriptional regulator, acetate operon repressor